MSASEPAAKPRRSPLPDIAAPRSVPKGRQTRVAIVEAALGLATQIGLEGLSIGALAEVMRMSKSGVFAHFGSREELQLSVVRHYQACFEDEVFFPALKAPRGLPRLQALFRNWMQRTSAEIDSGCIYISGAVEFDDRPGPVREALAESVRNWLAAMNRAVVQARDAGHLRPDADAQQIVFEIHGLILALHYEARFLNTPASLARAETGFAGILARHGCVAQIVPDAAQAPALDPQAIEDIVCGCAIPDGRRHPLGHPLGATGAIRAATVIHALQRHQLKYGMLTMCVGMGQGAAGIFERV